MSAITESPFLYVVGLDVDDRQDQLFNRAYDREHVPNLRAVDGVGFAQRFRRRAVEVMIEGRRKKLELPAEEPDYYAVYGLTDPDVLLSDAWQHAGQGGEWSQVRPFISNRRRLLLEGI